MKGRIQCPNCSKQFEIENIDDSDDAVLTCPYCNRQFNIQSPSSGDDAGDKSLNEDCSWEEHGEPRKTILSAVKPRTDKPMIATLLLIVVVCMGIISSVTPGLFLQTPVMIFSAAGMQGSISIDIDEGEEIIFDQVNLIISSDDENYQGLIENNSILFQNLPLGVNNGELHVYQGNESDTIGFEFEVIPLFSNSYTLTPANQNDSKGSIITHNGFGWCTIILLILSVVCLIGLFSAWRRNYSDVALIGCLVGVFTIGFFFIGSILSIIAFYLIYQSRDEFDDGKKGKSF